MQARTSLSGLRCWCKIVDALQTIAIEENENPKLKYLAGVFSLSGNLI
jgi:hypothetical protein